MCTRTFAHAALGIVAFAGLALFAPPTIVLADEAGESHLTSASVISATFPAASTAMTFVPLFAPQTAATIPWIANPIRLGAHIPLYWIDPPRAIGYSVAGLTLPAAGIGLMFASGSIAVAAPLSTTLLNGYSHLMEYAAYDTYRLGDGPQGGYSLGELAAAPFRGKNLGSPLVWVPSLVGSATLVAFYLLAEPDLGTPVYETGQSHVGTATVGPAVGAVATIGFGAADMLAVSVGEEAYYRGIIYEEAKRSLGTWPARAGDMLVFPAVHLASDLQSGFHTQTVVFNFLWRSAMTLVFDIAKDEGGLPLSVAVHFWSDLILIAARWFFYGG